MLWFQSMEGRVKAGKVDCDRNQYLCQQAGIRAYPTVRFYPSSVRQAYRGEDIDNLNAQQIISYLNRKVPQKKVGVTQT